MRELRAAGFGGEASRPAFGDRPPAVIHSFSGPVDYAREVLRPRPGDLVLGPRVPARRGGVGRRRAARARRSASWSRPTRRSSRRRAARAVATSRATSRSRRAGSPSGAGWGRPSSATGSSPPTTGRFRGRCPGIDPRAPRRQPGAPTTHGDPVDPATTRRHSACSTGEPSGHGRAENRPFADRNCRVVFHHRSFRQTSKGTVSRWSSTGTSAAADEADGEAPRGIGEAPARHRLRPREARVRRPGRFAVDSSGPMGTLLAL